MYNVIGNNIGVSSALFTHGNQWFISSYCSRTFMCQLVSKSSLHAHATNLLCRTFLYLHIDRTIISKTFVCDSFSTTSKQSNLYTTIFKKDFITTATEIIIHKHDYTSITNDISIQSKLWIVFVQWTITATSWYVIIAHARAFFSPLVTYEINSLLISSSDILLLH